MIDKNELLPCPFCGNDAYMVCDMCNKIYTARCSECGASIGVHWGNRKKIAPHIVRVMCNGGYKVKTSERDDFARRLAVKRWNDRADNDNPDNKEAEKI